MLTRLFIRNYALITESEIRFDAGLNILTGETGAGKSLLMGALGLILGKRVDFGMLFNPEEKCIVEAEFSSLPPSILDALKARDEFDTDENTILVRREASPSGKSRAFVNDTPVSLSVLREVTTTLVDLHGQHENQKLLAPAHQLELLDQFGGNRELSVKFREGLKRFQQIENQLEALREREKEARQQEDYLRFQLNELGEANLDPEEESELEGKINRLQNAEEIKEVLGRLSEGLYNSEASTYNQLSEYRGALRKISGSDQELEAQLANLEDILVRVQDCAYELERINDAVEADPSALQVVEDRLDTYNKLKMKFSVLRVEELLELEKEFADKLDQLGSLEDEINSLGKLRKQLKEELELIGLELEKKRIKVIPDLEASVNRLLKEVGFQSAAFRVEMTRNLTETGVFKLEGKTVSPAGTGFNKIDFLIRTNKGVPEGPVAQIASGGEISRVMLAVKAALAGNAELAVLIFDEIDTGISGEVARMVGKVMKNLGSTYQIIAITHLPQIAGQGNMHHHIFKEEHEDRTVSRVRSLSDEERVEELARMISGDTPTASALENARELLKHR